MNKVISITTSMAPMQDLLEANSQSKAKVEPDQQVHIFGLPPFLAFIFSTFVTMDDGLNNVSLQ